MHRAQRLDEAVAKARRRGFQIRAEWLAGAGCTTCEIRGQPWLFIDLALDTAEQLAQVLAALETSPVGASADQPEAAPLSPPA